MQTSIVPFHRHIHPHDLSLNIKQYDVGVSKWIALMASS
jgi:hypothetical protein